MTTLDTGRLEAKVKDMYRQVAEQPHGSLHFELGEQVAARGYGVKSISVLAVKDG